MISKPECVADAVSYREISAETSIPYAIVPLIMTKEHLGLFVEELGEPPDPNDPETKTTYGDDSRDAILDSLEAFCERLDFRLAVFTDRDPSMLAVFESDVNLQSKMIGQQVHTFIGRNAIEPVVSAINYEYIAEPRRSQPELEQNREQVSTDFQPDFRLIPREWSGSIPPDIIGEIKKPGASKSAVKELRGYLSETEPPAYGIATDGITWHGLKREPEKITRLSGDSHVPLRPLLHKIRRGIVHERAEYELAQFRTSSELNRFVSLFEQIPG